MAIRFLNSGNISGNLEVNKLANAAVEIAKFKVTGTGGSFGAFSFVSILPGSGNFATQLRLHTNNTGNNFQSINNNAGVLELATNDSNPLVLKTNSTTRLTISNVGAATFTGSVSGITPTAAANFVTKAYIDGGGGAGSGFLPLSAGSGFPLTGDLYINKSAPVLRLNDSGNNVPYELRVDGTTFSIKEVSNSRTLMSMTAGAVITLDSLGSNTVINTSGAMVVPNGKVAIGTTSPTAGSQLTVRSSASTGIDIRSASNTGECFINFSDNDDTNVGQIFYGHSPDRMVFRVGDDSRVTILGSSGNVGIATTNPGSKLTVDVGNGDFYSDTTKGITAYDLTGGVYTAMGRRGIYTAGSHQEFRSASSYMAFYTGTNGNPASATEKMRIDTSGNLKLAITNATSNTVIGKDAGGMYMETSGSTDALSDMRFQSRASGAGNYSAIKIKPSIQSLEFVTSNAERMRIYSNGDIAMGDQTNVEAPNNGILKLKTGVTTANTCYPLLYVGGSTHLATRQYGIGFDPEGYQNRMKLFFGVDGMGRGYSLGDFVWNINQVANSTIVTNADERMRLTKDGYLGIGTDSPNVKLQVAGKAIINTTGNYTSGAGALSVNNAADNNGGIVDTHSNGAHRYYTRVCQASTSSGSAGYWHIKTNITIDSSTMFLAKFYGYVYGQAGITDLQHGAYAYNNGSGGAVINQVTTNNSSNTGMTSAIYTSTTGNKLCFRIDLNGSTYYAGLWMDIGFQNPTGGSWNFNIEGTTFNATANYY